MNCTIVSTTVVKPVPGDIFLAIIMLDGHVTDPQLCIPFYQGIKVWPGNGPDVVFAVNLKAGIVNTFTGKSPGEVQFKILKPINGGEIFEEA